MTLKQVGRYEYETLITDMSFQGEEFTYPGGFEAWYKEVFMQDEAWEEIRREAKLDRV